MGTTMCQSAIIEVIFGLNGLGNTLVQAIFNRDYPLVQAAALFLAAVFVLVNTSVDLLYGFLDPRIKQACPMQAAVRAPTPPPVLSADAPPRARSARRATSWRNPMG